MMKHCYFSIILILYASMLFAQESPVITTMGAFQNYTANHPVEKIYLHLDKPYYAAGEYMYFRAYLTDMDLIQENVESGIIYVELSDAKKNLVKRILLYSEENEFAGQIELPDSLPSADYHLRAYTNWMRNAGEDYFYHRDIYIGSITDRNSEITKRTFDYQVSFFPEGGRLLVGLENKVAFKALGNDGFGTEVTGNLFEEDGKELLQFSSLHFGMGSFNFSPEKGKKYKAVVQSGGLQKEYALLPTEEGISLSVKQDDEFLHLTIHSTLNEPETIYIIGQSRHAVCYASEGIIKDELQIRVDKAKFPTGIAQFTLFKNGNPISERLIFIDRKDDLQVTIIPDKEEYGDREKATVRIRISDKDGKPVEGSFSLSVTDDKTVLPSINEQNIKGSLLLDSDLKGYVESPGWYFAGDESERSDVLDNLLCTQGWSRFVWDKLETKDNIYPAESEFQITGKITNFIGLPVKDASIILFGREYMPGRATTDKDGKFGFYGFDCPEGTEFLLQCRTKSDRKAGIGFSFDKPLNIYSSTYILPLTKFGNNRNQKIIEDYTEQVGLKIKNEKGIWSINLPEVTVKAKRIPSRQSVGFASYRFGGKALEKSSPIKLELKSLPSPIMKHPSEFLPQRVLYIVDGVVLIGGWSEFEEIYGSWPASMFESIDVIRREDAISYYGVRGPGYKFTTKRFTGNYTIPDASIEVIRPEGYCVRKEFFIPAYEKPNIREDATPDLRTTIYWNPVVITNKAGRAEVSFYTADNTGTYSFVLEGIGDDKIAITIK